jgi:pilus assembly protein CpaF
LGEKVSHSDWSLVQHYFEPIIGLFDDPEITEIFVSSYDRISIIKAGVKVPLDLKFESERFVATTITQVGYAADAIVDPHKNPTIGVSLWNGARFEGTLFPSAVTGSFFTIRIPSKRTISPEYLVDSGSFSSEMLAYFKLAINLDVNILISGSTNSGKTTLLNALITSLDPSTRVIAVEDTPEIKSPVDDFISLKTITRESNGVKSLADPAFLIKATLRHNADRVMVGEIRDADAADAFIQALNVGTNGCLTTIHANNAEDAIYRVSNFLMSKKYSSDYARSQVCRNLGLVIQVANIQGVGRRVTEVAEVWSSGEIKTLFSFNNLTKEHVVYHRELQASEIIKEAARLKLGFDLSSFSIASDDAIPSQVRYLCSTPDCGTELIGSVGCYAFCRCGSPMEPRLHDKYGSL